MKGRSILYKAHHIPLVILLLYPVLLFLLTIPWFQKQLIFLHWVSWPLWAEYENPERYGLAPYKTRNFRLNTSDGETLGVWHVLPKSTYQALNPFPPTSKLDESIFETSLRDRPTILYFHGNAANRAAPHRVRSYSAFSALDVNVLAIDYRGFGDSTGTPSEPGLLTDARAIWDYVNRDGISGEGVILMGQSLGTGVVAGLAGNLADEGMIAYDLADGIHPRAIILIALFTSITDLLNDFWLFGFIPLLSPLKSIPLALEYFKSYIAYPFNSAAALAKTKCPILILHARDDDVIPHHHSSTLFSSLADTSKIDVVSHEGWGNVSTYRAEGGEIVFWDGSNGGHNDIGWAEGSVDLVRRVAGL